MLLPFRVAFFNDLLGLKGTTNSPDESAAARIWVRNLSIQVGVSKRLEPSSPDVAVVAAFFLFFFLSHCCFFFFLFFLHKEFQKKTKKKQQQQKRPEQQQEEGEIQVMAAGSAKAWPQQLDMTIISTAFSWHSILSSS